LGAVAAIFVTAGILATPALAQDHDFHDRDRHDHDGHDRDWHGGWHDHDIHHFGDRDFALWRSGRWFRGHHDGRIGWWWIAGGAWYFYPAPVYPYPDPYLPPGAVAAPPAPRPTYYYCDNPPGYYPYVQACPIPWRPVPG
jgi:hypothetical protein